MRKCRKCGIEKPLDQFEKHAKCREGHTHRCWACAYESQQKWKSGKEERLKGYHRRYYLESKGEGYIPRNERKKPTPEQLAERAARKKARERDYVLRTEYGIDSQEYDRMFAAQDGKCMICGDLGTAQFGLAVDHNHVTGAVRALLCVGCNVGIGRLRDNAELCDKAAAYLRKHSA